MNCTTCRYELSQCLDGRLPSGRRTVVMQHASQCEDCGAFWTELQAAQQLTLRLRRPRVSADFRDSLWQRIEAGEGTPDAVFHEPVPMVAKLRYALTGAAAAAAALLCVTWLGPQRDPVTQQVAKADTVEDPVPSAIAGSTGVPDARIAFHQDAPPIDANPLISSTQRLGFNLVAREAAKQLDQRYAGATMALRRLANGSTDAVEQVLENADEFQSFGELLLDMRDSERLVFTNAEVEPDLRFAVNMLGQSRRSTRDLQTVQTIVAPAFRSDRLASISRAISLVPLEPREEMDALLHLNTQRPEIFPKLFFVFGNDDGICREFGLFRSGSTFFMADDCGPSLVVAPRSEVEAREGFWRVFRSRSATANGKRVEVQVQVKDQGR